MTSTAEQVRSYEGPAVLSFGFRPFFLAAATWAVIALVLWISMLDGRVELPTAFSPIEWHVHELIYGYVPAVVAGFLLTAVPNWTGRLPVVGSRLLALFLLWLTGRFAVFVSLWIGATVAAALDVAFLVVLGLTVMREILASKNRRNLKVLVAIAVFAMGNVVFHAEAIYGSGGGYGIRIGIATTLFLIMVIGGRIIPSFTRNWLAGRRDNRLPASFDRTDVVTIAVSVFALAGWIAEPNHEFVAVLMVVAGAANALRMARWRGRHTPEEPLVFVLHVAFAFVPIGFVLLAISALLPDLLVPAVAVHGWTAGAIPLMTLAVMKRASLGHTGRALAAGPTTKVIYLAAFLCACIRIAAGLEFQSELMLQLSGVLWLLAFGGFVVGYGPLLVLRRT